MSDRMDIAGIALDRITEGEVIDRVAAALRRGAGGHIVTPNVDIVRAAGRDPELRDLIASADLSVADGMPLVWASRLFGHPLPERVTGSDLLWSLSAMAASAGYPIYLLGGAPGVPQRAGAMLRSRFPGLVVAGADAPPYGFDASRREADAVRQRMAQARPRLVYVGLGFPRQDRFIRRLRSDLPDAWFLGCGSAIAFAAEDVRRAPRWMRDSGLEWFHRLMAEPGRLARRYLVNDLPFAVRLLARAWLGAGPAR